MTDSTFTIQQNTVNGLVSTLDAKASIDLSNCPYTTNRILEIPQNIKLEFDNGTVTLKAGSKLYDGLGGEHIVPSDMSFSTATGASTKQIMLIKTDFSTALFASNDDTYLSYNSTTGLIDYTGLGSYYLPAGVTIHSGSTYTGIESIFNGFGFVVSTVFALPGVKLQQADGRNADGTNKVLIQTVSSLTLHSISALANNSIYNFYWHKTSSNPFAIRDFGKLYYNSSTNLIDDIDYPGSVRGIILGTIRTDSNHKIIDFKVVDVDSVANSNASNFNSAGRSHLSSLGMPSSKYIDLTLGASGSSYIAPANGTLVFRKTVTGANQYVYAQVNGIRAIQDYGNLANSAACISVDVTKGDTIYIAYDAAGTIQSFRFFYAQGEN